jgi:hypothetical protein
MSITKRKKPSATIQLLKLYDNMSPKEQADVRQRFLEDEEDINISHYRLKHPGKTISHQELKKKLGFTD